MQNDNAKIKIIPALLESDLEKFKSKLKQAATFSNIVQIDIADGVFVPNKTLEVAQVAQYAQNAQVEIEWHLMVLEPEVLLSRFKAIKHETIIFHYEAVNDPQKTIDAIKQLGHKVGIALNPATPAENIDRLAEKIDLVTVMGVNPGFQGSPFIPASLKKIKAIKRRFPNLLVEIDGGVNESNLADVAASVVDQIVIGSGLWKSKDPKMEFEKLTKWAKQVS